MQSDGISTAHFDPRPAVPSSYMYACTPERTKIPKPTAKSFVRDDTGSIQVLSKQDDSKSLMVFVMILQFPITLLLHDIWIDFNPFCRKNHLVLFNCLSKDFLSTLLKRFIFIRPYHYAHINRYITNSKNDLMRCLVSDPKT